MLFAIPLLGIPAYGGPGLVILGYAGLGLIVNFISLGLLSHPGKNSDNFLTPAKHNYPMDLKRAKELLSGNRAELYKRFRIRKMSIFGSYARGEQKKGSDIDILVEFERVPGLFGLLGAEERLSTILGSKVDLVTRKSLHPIIAKQALKEAVAI